MRILIFFPLLFMRSCFATCPPVKISADLYIFDQSETSCKICFCVMSSFYPICQGWPVGLKRADSNAISDLRKSFFLTSFEVKIKNVRHFLQLLFSISKFWNCIIWFNLCVKVQLPYLSALPLAYSSLHITLSYTSGVQSVYWKAI